MNANNTIIKHTYKAVKFNKQSTIYECTHNLDKSSLLTNTVKIEVFQQYSKAYNLGLYFRIKDKSNWKASKLVTGLFKTTRLNWFYGDFKDRTSKTLIIFYKDDVKGILTVYQYPLNYYPSRKQLDTIIKNK